MDYIIWLACGCAALLELYIWSLCDKSRGRRARPSEIAGIIFFVLVFGGLSLAVHPVLGADDHVRTRLHCWALPGLRF